MDLIPEDVTSDPVRNSIALVHDSMSMNCFSEGEVMEKSTHPTAMMLSSTVNVLKTLALSSGVHAEVMQVEAVRTLCGLLRTVVESGTNDQSGTLTSH